MNLDLNSPIQYDRENYGWCNVEVLSLHDRFLWVREIVPGTGPGWVVHEDSPLLRNRPGMGPPECRHKLILELYRTFPASPDSGWTAVIQDAKSQRVFWAMGATMLDAINSAAVDFARAEAARRSAHEVQEMKRVFHGH